MCSVAVTGAAVDVRVAVAGVVNCSRFGSQLFLLVLAVVTERWPTLCEM